MTAIAAPVAAHSPTRSDSRTPTLRRVLRLDAALCAASGAGLVLAAGPLAELLDDPRPGVVRVVGVGLLAVAVDWWLFARSSDRWVRRGGAIAVAANLLWVAATVVLVAAGTFTTAGAVVAAVTAVPVLAFAVAEGRALAGTLPAPQRATS